MHIQIENHCWRLFGATEGWQNSEMIHNDFGINFLDSDQE